MSSGRDIYTRIVHGGRITLIIVLLVAIIVAPVGLADRHGRRLFRRLGSTGADADHRYFLAFPRLILALAFVAALGPGIENAVIAIALTAWPPYARVARAETLTLRESDFISAIRLQGASALSASYCGTSCRCAYPR